MRPLSCLMLLTAAAGCGHDGTSSGDTDSATAPPTDGAGTDAVGCPAPVDCADAKACELPPPLPRECLPITDFLRWIECSNGYVIIAGSTENSGVASYFRDGKLVAVFGGHLVLTCWNGPADFVRPDCTVVRDVDLCAKDASSP